MSRFERRERVLSGNSGAFNLKKNGENGSARKARRPDGVQKLTSWSPFGWRNSYQPKSVGETVPVMKLFDVGSPRTDAER